MVPIIQNIIPVSGPRPGKIKQSIKWIVIHETDNTSLGAGAERHGLFLQNQARNHPNPNAGITGWHYSVDDGVIVQHIPDEEVAWHAGDWAANGHTGGNGAGIGIEICVNPDSGFETAVKNTTELVALLLDKHDLDVNAVKQHNYFINTNCPRRIRDTGRWNAFLDMVRAEVNGANKPSTPSQKHPVTPPAPPSTNPAAPPQSSAFSVGDIVRVRNGALSFDNVAVASFIFEGTYRIDELNGKRAVLDKGGIHTAFRTSDLILANGAPAPTPPTPPVKITPAPAPDQNANRNLFEEGSAFIAGATVYQTALNAANKTDPLNLIRSLVGSTMVVSEIYHNGTVARVGNTGFFRIQDVTLV